MVDMREIFGHDDDGNPFHSKAELEAWLGAQSALDRQEVRLTHPDTQHPVGFPLPSKQQKQVLRLKALNRLIRATTGIAEANSEDDD